MSDNVATVSELDEMQKTGIFSPHPKWREAVLMAEEVGEYFISYKGCFHPDGDHMFQLAERLVEPMIKELENGALGGELYARCMVDVHKTGCTSRINVSELAEAVGAAFEDHALRFVYAAPEVYAFTDEMVYEAYKSLPGEV